MQRRAGSLTVAVTVCGTDGDPQGLARQMEMLAAAGAYVTRSAARAALLAVAAAAGP
jgi:FdrA protein